MWWEEEVGGGGGRRALVEAAAEALANCLTWEFVGLSIGCGEGKICTETKHKSGTALCYGPYGCNCWRLQPADGRLHTNQADKDK